MMISSERAQNVIVSFVIIAAVVSSVLLISNGQYYSGSYLLAGRMEVSLEELVVSDIDPENASIYPVISMTFNFHTDSPIEGDVRLTYIEAALWLNNDRLSYTVFNGYLNNDATRVLHPGYDRNFTLATRLNSNTDRNSVFDADGNDTWNWYIRFGYSFITFNEARSSVTRTLYFNWTATTII
ncbi:MAG: hypothetical protein ACFFDD_12100 [Promethearchaeota archaeon]